MYDSRRSDDGEAVYLDIRQVSSEGVGEWGGFMSNKLCGVREVVVSLLFSFSYLNAFNRRVSTSGVRVSDEYELEEADKFGIVSTGSDRGG
jgi:hypothetical protein